MHLADITALRTVSGAGLLMALTRRCPLSCAHCSTDSAMDSEQYSSAPFLGLVDTFTAAAHPEVMVLSGGEALLRPGLVADLAESARLAGTRTCLMSGMYFARRALGARGSVSQATMIPAGLRRAIGAVDHFAASLDVHHEREVGRDDVFRAFRAVLDLVPAASFHVTGLGDDDPYIEDLVARIRREFDDQVPVLVSRVQPTGRARKGLSTSRSASTAGLGTAAGVSTGPGKRVEAPTPCSFAAWPLVDYDGTVYACSRQSLAAHLRPAHLVLGDAGSDSWEVLRDRTLARPLLRVIRTLGPVEARDRFGTRSVAGTTAARPLGVCATCATLAQDPDVGPAADAWLSSPGGRATEILLRPHLEARDAQRFAARWGSVRYQELIGLGREAS